jgi:hypothetical protein
VARYGALLIQMDANRGTRALVDPTRAYFELLVADTQDAQRKYQTVVDSLAESQTLFGL